MCIRDRTRPILTRLVSLAEKYNVAIVLVCHFNKNSKGDSITRILGSMDIVGVGRSAIAIGNVPNEDRQKYMSHEKSSNAEHGKTKLFHIDPDNGGIAVSYTHLDVYKRQGQAQQKKINDWKKEIAGNENRGESIQL